MKQLFIAVGGFILFFSTPAFSQTQTTKGEQKPNVEVKSQNQKMNQDTDTTLGKKVANQEKSSVNQATIEENNSQNDKSARKEKKLKESKTIEK